VSVLVALLAIIQLLVPPNALPVQLPLFLPLEQLPVLPARPGNMRCLRRQPFALVVLPGLILRLVHLHVHIVLMESIRF
jgi:hypothetical protein